MTMLPMDMGSQSLFSGSDITPPQMPQYKSGGMFGGNGKLGVGQAIIAALNGYLASRHNPVGIANMQMMQQQAQQKAEESQYQHRHAQELQDQMSLYDYKAAHPDTPDITARIEALNGIEPGLGSTYAHNYAANGGGMGPMLVNPQTGQQMVPQAKAPAQAPPPQAVQDLHANPGSAAQFDEIFGPGSAARILGAGGPASQAPGGFPGQ